MTFQKTGGFMRFISFILLLLAAPVAVNAQAMRPVEQFARLPFMEGPSLSPDGTRVAARIAINGQQMFAILRLKGDGEKLTLFGVGDKDLNWWSWVNDDWLVAGVGGTEYFQNQELYIRRAISISADGKVVKPIALRKAAQGADNLLWIAKDGSPRVLLAMQTSFYSDQDGFWPQVHEVNVATGKTRMVNGSQKNVVSWYADASGTVRMGYGLNDLSRTSFIMYRPDEKSGYRTISRAKTGSGESLIVPLVFTADPDKAIASSDESGFDALYELDLKTMELGRQIFKVDGYDVGGAITDRSGTGLRGVSFTDQRSRVRWLDPAMVKAQAEIDRLAGSLGATVVSIDRSGARMIVRLGGPDRPGTYHYYDAAAPEGLPKISDVNPDIGAARLSPVKTIRYKSRDGLEIEAVLTMPRGGAAENLPMILLPHGGPFARDEESWDWWTQFLASRGYAVLQPNYRGSSGYGTEFAHKGMGEWGLKMQDDLNDAVDWAVKSRLADPKRICIAGASYGGYAAFRAAQRDPSLFRCAISYAGVSDLGAMMRYDRQFLNSGIRRDWLKRQAPNFPAVSPINFPSQFGVPLLVMHGKKDKSVPVKQSREMVEKLREHGKEVVYIEQPEGDHHFSREADRLQFLKEMETFLAKHNPT